VEGSRGKSQLIVHRREGGDPRSLALTRPSLCSREQDENGEQDKVDGEMCKEHREDKQCSLLSSPSLFGRVF